MSKHRKAFGFESLEDRVVLSGNSMGHFSEIPPEVKPAEFYKNWIEINSVSQTISPGEQAYTVNNTIIVQGGADASGDTVPTEEFSLGYAEVEWSYSRK